MKLSCRFCLFAAGAAFLSLASLAGWAIWQTPSARAAAAAKPDATSSAKPHARAPQVLAGAMERLHQEALAHFHSDPKNGFARLPYVYEKIVKDWKTPQFSSGDLDQDSAIPFRKDMERIHKASLGDFLALKPPPLTGDVNPRKALLAGAKFDATKKVYEAKSVDLVGLLKNDEPVVYVSEKINPEEATDAAPTRPLDEFEMAGLESLRMGADLFGRTKQDVIRLVGSVRAEKSCVRCHREKKEGDLLGAFSYVLREAQYNRTSSPFRKKAVNQ